MLATVFRSCDQTNVVICRSVAMFGHAYLAGKLVIVMANKHVTKELLDQHKKL